MNRKFSGIKLGMEATFRAAQMKDYTQQLYGANAAITAERSIRQRCAYSIS